MKMRFLVSTLVILGLGACSSQPPVASSPTGVRGASRSVGDVLLVYQSNRQGTLTPCGCHSNPAGGIDREANALKELKKFGLPTLHVDAGNLLAPAKPISDRALALDKARFVAKMVAQIGLDVFAPGPMDYALGIAFLKEMRDQTKAQFVSTNVLDEAGNPVFAPYTVKNVGGVKFGFLSITPPTAGLKLEASDTSLEKWLPKVRQEADVVVLLSQLGNKKDEELLLQGAKIDMIVGSDPKTTLSQPLWYPGGRILVDPHVGGFYLGTLRLKPILPFQGFYSPVEVAANQKQKEILDQQEKDPNPAVKATAERGLSRLKKYGIMNDLPNGTIYYSRFIKLDERRYGKPNEVSAQLKAHRNQVREKAVMQAE